VTKTVAYYDTELIKDVKSFIAQFPEYKISILDKIKLTGLNLGQVFNSRSGCMSHMHFFAQYCKTDQLRVENSRSPFQGQGALTERDASVQLTSSLR